LATATLFAVQKKRIYNRSSGRGYGERGALRRSKTICQEREKCPIKLQTKKGKNLARQKLATDSTH
jgi:hypothetical protein